MQNTTPNNNNKQDKDSSIVIAAKLVISIIICQLAGLVGVVFTMPALDGWYKNLKKPIIKTENFFQNKFMFFGVAYGFLLIFLAIYLPFLNKVLGTTPLASFHWLLVFSVALIATLIVELVKISSNFLRKKVE